MQECELFEGAYQPYYLSRYEAADGREACPLNLSTMVLLCTAKQMNDLSHDRTRIKLYENVSRETFSGTQIPCSYRAGYFNMVYLITN